MFKSRVDCHDIKMAKLMPICGMKEHTPPAVCGQWQYRLDESIRYEDVELLCYSITRNVLI